MNLASYQAGSLFDRFNADMGRLYTDAFRTTRTAEPQVSRWSPAVDIQETEAAFVLYVDVPGSKPEDIDITVDDGVLSVKGKREVRDQSSADDYKRIERVQGEFVRQFSLPETASTESIEAKVDSGVLTLPIPKVQKPEPKKITVS